MMTITNGLTKSSTVLVKDCIECTTKRMTSDSEVVDLVYDDPQAHTRPTFFCEVLKWGNQNIHI